MIDRVVVLRQLAGFLVVDVTSLAGNVLVRFGEQRDGFAATVTDLLTLGRGQRRR